MDLPRNVRWFERLSYGSLAMTTALLPFNERAQPVAHRLGAAAYLIWLCFFILWIFVIRGISRHRQNWLRWARLALLLFAWLGVIEVVSKIVLEPIYFATWFTSMILDSAACY